jgi:hypothetical protein
MEKRGKGKEELLRENYLPFSLSVISIFPLSPFFPSYTEAVTAKVL